MSDAEAASAVERYRGAVGAAIAIGALGYLGYAVWHGLASTGAALGAFSWPIYVPVLLLTLVNYGLRFAKWAWLLRRLGVDMPLGANALAFTAGLGMVVSPGKAGELVKPWLVQQVTGVSMVRTIPALVTERLTDGIAVVVLAAIGVGTFAPERKGVVALGLLIAAGSVVLLAVDPRRVGISALLRRFPGGPALVEKLEAMSDALRTCLGPGPLVVTLLLSLVAWFAECVGYWLVFRGLSVDAGLDVSTFLYAFATVFGAPSPGGMGMADLALVEGSLQLIPALGEGEAMAAALLVRVATLWFGVLLGALVLLRIDAVVRMGRRARGA